MEAIAQEIRSIVAEAYDQLATVDSESAARKETPSSWSKQELLGHLIDSATNNHQRFVRACYNDAANFPPYSQTDWVRVQQYNQLEWKPLVELWAAYNRHLCDLIERIPREALRSPVNIGHDEPVTLEFVVKDYLRHLEHHLKDLIAQSA
jgi:hypothetical protein